jgi:Core-2/I-Branching enzyme
MPTPRIAFLVLAHQDPPQLERLCRLLNRHAVFVHIDGRAADFPVDQLCSLPQVTVVAPRITVHWGGFSMVEATLTLLKTAQKQADFDSYVLIAGSSYPVKPLTELEAALARNSEREWIALTPVTPGSHLHKAIGRKWRMAPLLNQRNFDRRLRAFWNKVSGVLGRDLEREIGMTPYFGSQWWALSGRCVKNILDFVDSHPGFVRAYRSTWAPDELFFHTIVGNSAFGKFAIHVEENGNKTNHFSPLTQVATDRDRYLADSPADLELAKTTEKFFIRKVSSGHSQALLDQIDRELLHGNEASIAEPTVRA